MRGKMLLKAKSTLVRLGNATRQSASKAEKLLLLLQKAPFPGSLPIRGRPSAVRPGTCAKVCADPKTGSDFHFYLLYQVNPGCVGLEVVGRVVEAGSIQQHAPDHFAVDQ